MPPNPSSDDTPYAAWLGQGRRRAAIIALVTVPLVALGAWTVRIRTAGTTAVPHVQSPALAPIVEEMLEVRSVPKPAEKPRPTGCCGLRVEPQETPPGAARRTEIEHRMATLRGWQGPGTWTTPALGTPRRYIVTTAESAQVGQVPAAPAEEASAPPEVDWAEAQAVVLAAAKVAGGIQVGDLAGPYRATAVAVDFVVWQRVGGAADALLFSLYQGRVVSVERVIADGISRRTIIWLE